MSTKRGDKSASTDGGINSAIDKTIVHSKCSLAIYSDVATALYFDSDYTGLPFDTTDEPGIDAAHPGKHLDSYNIFEHEKSANLTKENNTKIATFALDKFAETGNTIPKPH